MTKVFMANIKSQIKRNRTNEIARERNKSAKSAIRTSIKKVKVAVEAKDLAAAEAALVAAFRLIDKSVSDGIQHKNTASRQKGEIQSLFMNFTGPCMSFIENITLKSIISYWILPFISAFLSCWSRI